MMWLKGNGTARVLIIFHYDTFSCDSDAGWMRVVFTPFLSVWLRGAMFATNPTIEGGNDFSCLRHGLFQPWQGPDTQGRGEGMGKTSPVFSTTDIRRSDN